MTVHDARYVRVVGQCYEQTHLQETLAVLGTPRTDDLKAGDLTVPRCVVLRVLSCDTGSSTVRATEDDGYGDIAARHVIRLAGRVDNLVDGLHGEVEGHKLATIIISAREPGAKEREHTLVGGLLVRHQSRYQRSPSR